MRIGARLAPLLDSPRYTAVRGMARFPAVRRAVRSSRALAQRSATREYVTARAARPSTLVDPPAVEPFVAALRRDGFAPGLTLSVDTVEAILAYAHCTPGYADRNPELGFDVDRREEAGTLLGKPVLLAQHFNTRAECPEILELSRDPLLESIAATFLGSLPRLVGSSLWWTFPVDADEADRDRHAHRFHRDVDDFAFVKFFFYLTDVEPADGGHVCVRGSHLGAPVLGRGERLRLRRYTDEEIEHAYGQPRIVEITGPAGTGFAENTLCIHKGLTPERRARLLLQFEFALFDHGVMHDVRDDVRTLPM